jgi:hypothetical protein
LTNVKNANNSFLADFRLYLNTNMKEYFDESTILGSYCGAEFDADYRITGYGGSNTDNALTK